MQLGNKILAIILGLVLLNLIREYIWVKPPDPEGLSSVAAPVLFDIQKKDWDYYKDVFKRPTIKLLLPLVLHGTIISNPQTSFAIIEDLSTGVQDLYGLGDIVSGAKIVAMNRNRVMLEYDGVKQELDMFDAGRDPIRRVPRCPETRHVQGEALHMSQGVDFAKLMTQIRIKPYFENGRCVGFQISNINGSIKQMGLEDGDIVESINGVRIDDPLKALEILYRNNPVHLCIERQDEKIELDFKLEG